MSIECRLGYLMKPKPGLIEQLRSVGSDLHEVYKGNIVIVTEKLDYEEYFEGSKRLIIEKCKVCFVREFVFNWDYSKDELYTLFGKFETELELFDRWWVAESAECEEIPTDWKKT